MAKQVNGFLNWKKGETVKTWQSAWANHDQTKYPCRLNPNVPTETALNALSSAVYLASNGFCREMVDYKDGFVFVNTYMGIGD